MGDVAFVAPTDNWTQCYNDSWKGIITEAAFAHPAKFSKGLIFKIVQHAIAAGWLQPGDTVVDPFGGVALGGLPCALQGVRWMGVELEPRFHALSLENIALWQRRYGALSQWVAPVILQGDSRFLQDVISQAVLCVSSPPYGDQQVGTGKDGRTGWRDYTDHGGGTGATPGQMAAMPTQPIDLAISSPPYADRCANDNQRTIAREGLKQGHNEGDGTTYGTAPGNLSTLPAGTVALSVSSPPYATGCAHTGGADPQPTHIQGGTVHHVAYGASAGQMGTLPEGQIQACLSSPPWQQQEGSKGSQKFKDPAAFAAYMSAHNHGHSASPDAYRRDFERQAQQTYGDHPDQLGNTQGTTFWEAAKVILEQVHAIFKPRGVAIWVLKSYVRDGQLVDFPADWQRLCEHVGFVTLHEHHALLVDAPTAPGLFGEDVAYYRTERKSFFRRLAERKGSPAINFEVVLCMHKPVSTAPRPLDEAWEQVPLIDGCVASPPYAESVNAQSHGIDWSKTGPATGNRKRGAGSKHEVTLRAQLNYGTTTGQLGAMPAGQPPTRED